MLDCQGCCPLLDDERTIYLGTEHIDIFIKQQIDTWNLQLFHYSVSSHVLNPLGWAFVPRWYAEVTCVGFVHKAVWLSLQSILCCPIFPKALRLQIYLTFVCKGALLQNFTEWIPCIHLSVLLEKCWLISELWVFREQSSTKRSRSDVLALAVYPDSYLRGRRSFTAAVLHPMCAYQVGRSKLSKPILQILSQGRLVYWFLVDLFGFLMRLSSKSCVRRRSKVSTLALKAAPPSRLALDSWLSSYCCRRWYTWLHSLRVRVDSSGLELVLTCPSRWLISEFHSF